MRIEDPTQRATVLKIFEKESHYRSLWERTASGWALVPFLPAAAMAWLARGSGDRTAGMLAVVLFVVVPVLSFTIFFLANVGLRTRAHRTTRRGFDLALDDLRRAPLHAAHDAPDGLVRVRGTVRRAASHDPFDARQPAFVVEDEHGVAVVDDDCLTFIGCNGGLPPDGTLVEVSGHATRRERPDLVREGSTYRESRKVLVFDGTPEHPIAITLADPEAASAARVRVEDEEEGTEPLAAEAETTATPKKRRGA